MNKNLFALRVHLTFSKVRYKNAELIAPADGDKYETGDFVQNGTTPENEWMSDDYRINSVYVTYNKKESTRTITAVIYTSTNADTVVVYTCGYRITPTSKTARVGENQTAFVLSYVIPETDTAGETIEGTIRIDFYAYSAQAQRYSANSKTVSYTFK